jgi:hypothetical protein
VTLGVRVEEPGERLAAHTCYEWTDFVSPVACVTALAGAAA